MTEKPLTDLQRRVLLGLLHMEATEEGRWAWSPNEIGMEIGTKTITGSGRGNGRGSGHRVFGAAQQIIPTLTSLDYRHRGLISSTRRDDGMSGSAFRLTPTGRAKARELREETKT